MLMLWTVNVVANMLNGDAQTTERLRNDAEVFLTYVFDGDIATGHGCHADE